MAWTESADGWWLTGSSLTVRVDKGSGAIDRLLLTDDPGRMNWVTSETNAWHSGAHGWGLGIVGGRPNRGGDDAPVRWQRAAAIGAEGDELTVTYLTGGWQVRVVRRPVGAALDERITLRNVLDRPRAVETLQLYTPFNTDLVGAAADLRQRCHAHAWAGGRDTWIKAVRWSGDGPSVALRAHTGEFAGYGLDGVTEFAGSPVRGDLSLVAAARPAVGAGEELAFGWTIGAYDDFPAATVLWADRYVLTVGESTALHGAPEDRFTATEPGVFTIGLPSAKINIVVVPVLEPLLEARTSFITARQQDPESGALLPFDNRYDAMLRHPHRADFNDGRERVGMGVLLAQRRRTHPSPALEAATDRYASFVAGRLQSPAGQVYDGSTSKLERLYNYPWVCRFWLEMYAATGRDEYAGRFYDTIRYFYRAGGAEFYAIGIPILRSHQLLGPSSELAGLYRGSADFIRSRGADYPSHEVPFEQTIVGPAATTLLELGLVTGDPSLRRAAGPHLDLLTHFGGPQPDGRLHDVPIRYWDGYWFGARERWGDVMPHHWAAVSAWAWALRAATDDDQYWWDRATQLAKATLHTFTADGRASAAFVYPAIVNGNHEHQFDPLANDQDWALVTAQDIRDLADSDGRPVSGVPWQA